MDAVYVRLIGGLGNQMFQYATGRALALRNGAELKLDVSGFVTYGLRRYELDSYPIAATVASAPELEAFASAPVVPPRTGVKGLLSRLVAPKNASSPAVHYREPHFQFDPGVQGLHPPILLDGYWQTERYFADAAEALRRELDPTEPLEEDNARIAEQIDQAVAVSLHVRRGDYVSNAHANAYHGVCSLDYYRAAISHVAERVEGVHLFVFSDDAEWTRENLKSDLPATYVAANPPDRGFRDMQLMTRCRHHIIANSSFSWWGAWLNAKPGKVVVAPRRWFAKGDNDTRDLVPSDWVRL